MKRLIALAMLAIAVTAYVKRPVKQPDPTGTWDPAEHQRTSR
jgi:hypothetical protein